MERASMYKQWNLLGQGVRRLSKEQDLRKQPISILELNEGFKRFLNNLGNACSELEESMRLRQSLLRQASESAWNDEMLREFYADQKRFYQQAWQVMEEDLFERADHCGLNITAKELLLLVRILKEEGVLVHEQAQGLFKYVSLLVRTGKQESLSAESLRKKYYTAMEVDTLKKVKRLLFTLLKRTDLHLAELSNK